MKEFKAVKIKMKYDSIDLKAGDVLVAKTDAEYRNLTGRGGQVCDDKVEKEEKVEKKSEVVEEAVIEKSKEKSSKKRKKDLESKEDKTLDKE